MANITPGLPPQHYIGAIDTTWSFSADVDKVAYTVNDIPPAISEYIAYDTLTPPNPFIAVTQDGKGNVVYDGGFPKFYNAQWRATYLTFADLPGGFKYLYNALNFCANPIKVAAGNRKVLMLGDTNATSAYPVKTDRGTGFSIAMTGLCNVAGYQLTIKDVTDYAAPNSLRPTYAELDEYCCVIMFSTAFTQGNPDLITNSSIVDMVTYREQGNGLIFITDHGDGAVKGPADIRTSVGTGFYATANRVIINFGAFFTGNFNRTPVNVGFLRRTYGDHPLYNGMLDTESISAGGSESRVVVTINPVYGPGDLPNIPLSTPGEHTINFLLILKDGSFELHKFKYTVVDGEVIFAQNSAGIALKGFHDTAKRIWDGGLKSIEANPPTMLGTILRNDVLMGSFVFDGIETAYNFLAGPTGFVLTPGDVITHAITAPYLYRVNTTVRNNFIIGGRCSQATIRRNMAVNEYAGLTPEQAYAKIEALTKIWYNDTPRSLQVHPVLSGSVIRMLSGGPTGAARIPVYATTAALQAALPSITNRSLMLLDASTAATWWYVDGAWALTKQPLAIMLGINRRVISTLGNGIWLVNSSTTVVKLS